MGTEAEEGLNSQITICTMTFSIRVYNRHDTIPSYHLTKPQPAPFEEQRMEIFSRERQESRFPKVQVCRGQGHKRVNC